MKSKAIIPLLLGVVVGLVAIKFLVDTLQRAKGAPPEMIATVVARTDVPASAEITADMVALVQTPQTPLIPEGAFSSVEGLVGRVASKAIPQGAVIGAASLAPPGTPSGLTERIEEGYRAVSVKIDEVSGVAGQIIPGSFVDVIVVMRISRGRTTETISRIILQRIKVLAVGQNLGSPSETGGGPQKLAKSVTLLVRDLDVPKLHLAQTQGKVTLAMRGSDDRLAAEDGHASTDDWVNPEDPGGEAQPAPDPAPPVTPADRVFTALGAAAEPVEIEQPFAVTVFNGPLRADGTAGVQQVIYKNRRSMEVVNVGAGRSGEGRAESPDAAESILRDSRRGGPEQQDRYPDRAAGGSAWIRQPQDREIPEE